MHFTTLTSASLLLAASLPSLASASCSHLTHISRRAPPGAEYSYEAPTDPEHWSDLDASYEACGNGNHQSPINIHAGVYDVSSFPGSDIQVAIDGSKGVMLENLGTSIMAYTDGNITYARSSGEGQNSEWTGELVQFHFHTPSEHHLSGEQGDGEVHFVFENAQEELTVLGVLLTASEGQQAGGALDTVLRAAPEEKSNGTAAATEGISFEKVLEHVKSHEIWTYSGSLTTPPCSEGVNWLVSSETFEVSKEALDRVLAITGPNAREPQGELGEDNLNEENGEEGGKEESHMGEDGTITSTIYACPTTTLETSTVEGSMTTQMLPGGTLDAGN